MPALMVLRDLVILLAVAIPVAAIAHRARLSTVAGFLLAGVAIGPYGFALISRPVIVAELAELLRGSYYARDGSLGDVLQQLGSLGKKTSNSKEWLELVTMATQAQRLRINQLSSLIDQQNSPQPAATPEER